MGIRKRITVTLSPDDLKFIKWMAKYYSEEYMENYTEQRIMQDMFFDGLERIKSIYLEYMEMEEGK